MLILVFFKSDETFSDLGTYTRLKKYQIMDKSQLENPDRVRHRNNVAS